MRAFAAIELPETIRARLQEEIGRLRQAGGCASWVRPEHMHLTLRFLGEIAEEQKTAISGMLRDICATADPLQLAVEGIGAFPNTRRPAVVWAGVRLVMGDLIGLQQKIEQAARNIGLGTDNKPFHPHVTLARIRDLAFSERLAKAVRDRADGGTVAFGDEFEAFAVALFHSDLKPGGPVHTRLEEYPLSCKSCL